MRIRCDTPMTTPPIPLRLDRGELGRELQPDTILPEQFARRLRGPAATLPEHHLMFAVLEDAIRCYQGTLNGHRGSRRCFRETEEWFESNDATWLFSFIGICEALDLEPEYIRAGLRRWRSREATRRPDSPPIPLRFRRVQGLRHHVTAPALGLQRHA